MPLNLFSVPCTVLYLVHMVEILTERGCSCLSPNHVSDPVSRRVLWEDRWVLMGSRAVGTEVQVMVGWAIFPEEGEKQKARLEEGSSVSRGLRERKKCGNERIQEEEEKVQEGCMSHGATFPQCLLWNEVCQKSPIVWKTEVLMRRNHILVLTWGHLWCGICQYLYHERFKWQCINPSVCPGSWLSTNQSILGRGRSTGEQLAS